MYTLIKKLCSMAALVGIALIICGIVSGMMLSDFEEHAVATTAYITTIEEGNALSNGYRVSIRYTVDGERFDSKIDSGNLGEKFRLLEAKAEAMGVDIIDYIDNASTADKTIDILYNSEIPGSVKYAEYEDNSKDFYLWGGILLAGSFIIALMNNSAKKKREERAAERRLEKKMAKQQGK